MSTLPRRTIREFALTTTAEYANPFTDVTVTVTFSSPAGAEQAIEAFYDGDDTWRVRFNPGIAGEWTWTSTSVPPNPELDRGGTFVVSGEPGRGLLRSTPGTAWGFSFENGEPAFIFGDTTYHLFGVAHHDRDHAAAVERFLVRRAEQGFNLLRIRVRAIALWRCGARIRQFGVTHGGERGDLIGA